MATIIFILSYLIYVIYLTFITSYIWLPLWVIISIILAFLTILIVYFLQFPLVLILPAKHPYKAYLMRSISYFLNHFILNLKVKVEGLENVPRDGRLVVYSNHKSYTDAFAILEKLPRPMTLTPKKSVLKIPIINAWIKAYDVFPINRNNPRETAIDLEKAVETVKNGHAILIFPEGTIKNRLAENVLTMKAGAFKLALKAEADILVIRLDGNQLTRGRAPFRRTHRKITILKPLIYEKYKNLTTQEISNTVMDMINDSSNQPYQ
jgi:1-acyl-sn-glycerol-3-phosphate acyltransferase